MKKLYRSKKERIIGGFCGGLAEYFQVDPVLVRIIFVIAVFINGVGVLLYLAGLIIVPNNPDENGEPVKISPLSRAKDTYFWGILAVVIGIILLIKESQWFYFFHIYDLDLTLLLGGGLILAGIYMIYNFSRNSSDKVSEIEENLEEARNNVMSHIKFYKKSDEKIISGVCAGIADYLKIDVSMVRIATVILAILTKGILVIAYILAIFMLPDHKAEVTSVEAVETDVKEEEKTEKKKDKNDTKVDKEK